MKLLFGRLYLSMAPFRLEILWRACDRSLDSCITEHQAVTQLQN